MISYQMTRGIIDSEKKIYQNPTEAQRRDNEKDEFALHEVYAVDILISSGDGKPKESDLRTTVYKKKDMIYQLRMKSSRTFLSEVEKRFTMMPFTLRHFDDEKRARLGVIECAKHELVEPYPIYHEKEGEFVAEFKFTLLLMPSGQLKITGMPLDLELFDSEYKINDHPDLKQLIISPVKKSQQKKKKKNKKSSQQVSTMSATTPIGGGDINNDGDDDDYEDEEEEVKKPKAKKGGAKSKMSTTKTAAVDTGAK